MATSEPTITDAEFTASKRSQEAVYRDEGGRQADRSYLDPLGHARWDTDYYTLRRNGYAHDAALIEVRCRIREAWSPSPLPAVEPHPEPPVIVAPPPPVVTPPVVTPPADRPGVKDNAERFASFYFQRTRRTGFKPNERSTRDQRISFLQATILEYRDQTGDRSFVMKRASDTRPISDEVIVFVGTREAPISDVDYRRFWDIVRSAETADWFVHADGPGEILEAVQPLVDPVTLRIIQG